MDATSRNYRCGDAYATGMIIFTDIFVARNGHGTAKILLGLLKRVQRLGHQDFTASSAVHFVAL